MIYFCPVHPERIAEHTADVLINNVWGTYLVDEECYLNYKETVKKKRLLQKELADQRKAEEGGE